VEDYQNDGKHEYSGLELFAIGEAPLITKASSEILVGVC